MPKTGLPSQIRTVVAQILGTASKLEHVPDFQVL